MKNKLLYIVFFLISLLPLWFLYLISDVFYLIVYKIFGYREFVVSKNLKNSFSTKSEIELEEIKKKFYRHFFDIIVETIKSVSANKYFFRNHIAINNIELLDKYHKNNQTVVLALAHFGNWEWGNIRLSIESKQKLIGIYKVLNNDFFNTLMKDMREKFGTEMVSMENTFRYLVKNKNECKIIGLLADQSPVKNESNYWTTFLNQDTSVYLGPEKIATKMNCAVLFCSVQRVKRGKYELHLEELCTNPEKTTEGEITSLYLRKMEQTINENPEYWLWTHRRWKHKK
ncbi:MAG: lysophospholipid acyltransferase family protein [Flavobacteriales bacterium]|nr:lysophospholipid acyltransferase family protein [Flavobacteriales bacterium]